MFNWEVTPSKAFNAGFTLYERAVKREVDLIMVEFAPRIESWMKRNAVWTDRTGNARQGLNADVELLASISAVEFAHGEAIDYGRWLELIQQGQYAIITPALDYFAPRIWREVQSRL